MGRRTKGIKSNSICKAKIPLLNFAGKREQSSIILQLKQ